MIRLTRRCTHGVLLALAIGFCACTAAAQTAAVSGAVTDQTGGALPGVIVDATIGGVVHAEATTDASGRYHFDALPDGACTLLFRLVNFSAQRRDIRVAGGAGITVNVTLALALDADVTVSGVGTFVNLADAADPAQNLVGIAQSASQGAITARQLDMRPLMRTGEVLETVPGVVVTQHSGEGKANQYFLRGFNLDHGTDLETTVAGMPVNMPTHAHGQGYTDLNFLIPELVTGVQFSKGPYYADQGDFATAGADNVNYATSLEHPIAALEPGSEGYARGLFAASPALGRGHLLLAIEAAHDDGPWSHPDDYRKFNGVISYSRGDTLNGFSVTGMGYHGTWNATDQVPQRALAEGLVGRFGAIDPTDGGHTYRDSLSMAWQHSTGSALTKVTAYGIAYDLDLFSDFTYFLDDPVHGDQIEQADHRFVTGVNVSHRRLGRLAGHPMQNTVGLQVRNDDITNVGLYHTHARVRLGTTSQDAVLETSAGVYAQNEVQWTPWLRSMMGLRGDGSRFRVDALGSANSGVARAGLVSPKGGVTIGPWKGTEFYVDAGTGFHSNDARGTTITEDGDGNPASPVTPLVRAKGAEVGVRTVAIPHLQSTVSVWMLRLDSELVFSGDEGTTDASLPSARRGVEWANYFSPRRWLVFDGDVSWSRARFTEFDPAGQYVPEAVGTVISAGATIDGWRRMSGSLRWRYFGPRTLIEDNSVRSKATSLVNLDGAYTLSPTVRVGFEIFNVLNAADSDIDYYYTSRLPGEPADGIDDITLHPTLPRTARATLAIRF